jgi:hypothetical protein
MYVCIAYLSQVNFGRLLRQLWFTFLQHFEPFLGQFRTSSNGLVPHNRKICAAAEILRYSHRFIQIKDDMPPTAGDKNGLAGFL